MSTTVVDEEFRRRLRLIMQQFGSVADLARSVGVSDNAIYKWVSGRGQPSMVSLVNLARAAGVSVEWLATGIDATVKHPPNPRPKDGQVAAAARTEQETLRTSSRPPVQSRQTVEHLSFSPEWLRRVFNIDPKSAALIEAVGDSMSPTIDEGDLVLVDLREDRFRHDGLYALRCGGDFCIKRIQRQPDGTFVLRSDNPAYQPFVIKPEDIVIFGRVIWVGGRP